MRCGSLAGQKTSFSEVQDNEAEKSCPPFSGQMSVKLARIGRLESLAIPGFWIDVAWLWQDPLPDALHCLEQILA